jgi:bacterioferritin-associated ferredoxin
MEDHVINPGSPESKKALETPIDPKVREADENTIICRCEDITRAEIMDCIREGYCTIDEIKRVTRAGMGPCQGRTCRLLIARELANYYHVPMEEVLMSTFRPPTKAISMGTLADAWNEEHAGGGKA